nr:hypothetical protein [Aquicoccus sp. G2-2]MEA1114968.1 hypothetical protein [Aquicoccus sp. G2-2]
MGLIHGGSSDERVSLPGISEWHRRFCRPVCSLVVYEIRDPQQRAIYAAIAGVVSALAHYVISGLVSGAV